MEDGGDLGIGGHGYFGNHKTWLSTDVGDSPGMYGNRSTNLGIHQRRSANARSGYDNDSFEGEHDSARSGYLRNQSAATIMSPATHGGEETTRIGYYRHESHVTSVSPNIGEHIREAVQEWQKKAGLVSQKLEETRQMRSKSMEELNSIRETSATEGSSSSSWRTKSRSRTNSGSYGVKGDLDSNWGCELACLLVA